MSALRDSLQEDFSFGAYQVSLLRPDPEKVRTRWESAQSAKPSVAKPGSVQMGFPFWSRVWPAARALSIFLSAHPDVFRRKRVLEIGAGLGLPSLLCAREAHSVRCTDLSEDAMRFAQASALLNGFEHFKCSVFDWTGYVQPLPCDLLLMSDVNYAADSFPHLLRLLEQYRQRSVTMLLSTPQRLSGRSFAASIQPWVRHTEEISVAEGTGEVPVSIFQL